MRNSQEEIPKLFKLPTALRELTRKTLRIKFLKKRQEAFKSTCKVMNCNKFAEFCKTITDET